MYVSIEKGDVNGSNICSGKFVAMSIQLDLFSYKSNVPDDDFSFNAIYVNYKKGKYRNCKPDELTSTSSAVSSSNSCCSDSTSLYGSVEDISSEVGTFTLGLKKDSELITAFAKVRVPLYDSSSTSSSHDEAPPALAATGSSSMALVTLKMDCTNVLNRHVTKAGDLCTRGECIHSSGQEDKYWCTTKWDDAALSGTFEVAVKFDPSRGQSKINLAKLPPGYTLRARAQTFTKRRARHLLKRSEAVRVHCGPPPRFRPGHYGTLAPFRRYAARHGFNKFMDIVFGSNQICLLVPKVQPSADAAQGGARDVQRRALTRVVIDNWNAVIAPDGDVSAYRRIALLQVPRPSPASAEPPAPP
ncbi:hypothetical protein JKP88DRAFT_287164 [Tribonema minus]|uniref:Uncharacterized protein n=1 Tax=Tribonema minus TaxID=303371 RepID=A0A835Z906_9STRA|nr:hypothetical protein JKP88DRAFT_287164 [Tribonema minus]